MANLIKRNARAPRVTNGYAYFGCDYAVDDPREPDGTPPVVYKVTVGNRNDAGLAQFKSEEYKLELTEEQMLEAVVEWMKLYARNQIERKKRQKNGYTIPR